MMRSCGSALALAALVAACYLGISAEAGSVVTQTFTIPATGCTGFKVDTVDEKSWYAVYATDLTPAAPNCIVDDVDEFIQVSNLNICVEGGDDKLEFLGTSIDNTNCTAITSADQCTAFWQANDGGSTSGWFRGRAYPIELASETTTVYGKVSGVTDSVSEEIVCSGSDRWIMLKNPCAEARQVTLKLEFSKDDSSKFTCEWIGDLASTIGTIVIVVIAVAILATILGVCCCCFCCSGCPGYKWRHKDNPYR